MLSSSRPRNIFCIKFIRLLENGSCETKEKAKIYPTSQLIILLQAPAAWRNGNEEMQRMGWGTISPLLLSVLTKTQIPSGASLEAAMRASTASLELMPCHSCWIGLKNVKNTLMSNFFNPVTSWGSSKMRYIHLPPESNRLDHIWVVNFAITSYLNAMP